MAKHSYNALFKAWQDGLLDKLKTGSKTSMIQTLPQESFFQYGKTLVIPDLVVGGFGQYNKTDGENTKGFIQKQVKTETYTIELDFDIGVAFHIDVVDLHESRNILTAENILRRHNDFHLIPAFDTYSFAKLLYKDGQGAEYNTSIQTDYDTPAVIHKPTIVQEGNADKDAPNKASGWSIDSPEKMLKQIYKATLAFENAEVPLENLQLFTTAYQSQVLEALKKGHLTLQNADKEVNYMLGKINDIPIVKVPTSRLWSQVKKDTMKKHNNAKPIGFLLLYVPAAFKAFGRNVIRVFKPSENINADSAVIQRRLHGTVSLYPGKEKGVYGYLLKS